MCQCGWHRLSQIHCLASSRRRCYGVNCPEAQVKVENLGFSDSVPFCPTSLVRFSCRIPLRVFVPVSGSNFPCRMKNGILGPLKPTAVKHHPHSLGKFLTPCINEPTLSPTLVPVPWPRKFQVFPSSRNWLMLHLGLYKPDLPDVGKVSLPEKRV